MTSPLTKAAAAGSPALSVPAASGHAAKPAAHHPAVTPFAYNATVYGTKVLTGGVEIRTLKDALINRGCTRQVNKSKTVPSLISTSLLPAPVSDFVKLSLNTSHTETYRDKAKGLYGVKGVSTLGDIKLGGAEIAGQNIPGLVLKGLESTANTYYSSKLNGGKGGFGEDHSFKYKGLGLDLNSDNPISDTLQTLLDALGVSDEEAVNETVAVPLNILLDTLNQVGAIEIPGLGTIALGQSSGSATKHGATANAYALLITLENQDAGLDPTGIELGQANSVISDGVSAGVFRTKMSAVEATVGNLLSVGGINQRTMACGGTDNKVITKKVAHAGIANVFDASGITYSYKGLQQGSKAKGFVQTTIGEVNLANAGVVVKGLTSRVDLLSKQPYSKVQSTMTTKIGSLLINGEEVKAPAVGQTLKFTDPSGNEGFITRGVLAKDNNPFFGRKLTALRVSVPGTDTNIDLGVANGQVFFG